MQRAQVNEAIRAAPGQETPVTACHPPVPPVTPVAQGYSRGQVHSWQAAQRQWASHVSHVGLRRAWKPEGLATHLSIDDEVPHVQPQP